MDWADRVAKRCSAAILGYCQEAAAGNKDVRIEEVLTAVIARECRQELHELFAHINWILRGWTQMMHPTLRGLMKKAEGK